jgi:predicted RNA binding protein YcfA (HicA-like mRNA interferase family)
MKWSEVERKATERGWYLVRNGSKHDIYGHSEKEFTIQIGRHRSEEVKYGLFCKLRKQIGF